MASKTSQWRTSSTVCRCCLSDGCYKDISTEYFWMGTREVYSEMLSKTLDVTISYSQTGGPNSNSRLICETCITRLRDASDFKRQVLECEKMFMKHLDSQGTEDTEATPNVFEAETADTVKVEYVKDEKDLSDNDGFDDKDFGFDNDDDDDLDDEPLMKLATKQTKKESIDLIDIIKTKSTEKRKSTSNTKATTAKKAKTKDVKPSASKTEKGARKKGPMELSGAGQRVRKETVNLLNNDGVRANAEIVLKYSTAYPFKTRHSTIRCTYCYDVYDTINALRTHMLADHVNSDINTAFYKLYEYLKVDITDMKCKLCSRDISDIDTLMSHLNSDHKVVVNFEVPFGVFPYKQIENDEWLCVCCQKIFPKFLAFNRHIGDHFKNLICDKCGTSFVTRVALKNHNRVVKCYKINYKSRDSTSVSNCRSNAQIILQCSTAYPFRIWQKNFNCIFCRVQSIDPCGLRQHMASRHANYDVKKAFYKRLGKDFIKIDVTNLQCKLCYMSVPNLNDLAFHLKEIHRQPVMIDAQLGVLPFQLEDGSKWKCAICPNEFPDFDSLSKHTSAHFQNYVCDTCGEGFITESALHAHTKIPHENKYKCNRCVAAFFTAEERSNHVKARHPYHLYICNYCKDKPRFASWNLRKRHLMESHNYVPGAGLYECTTCQKTFKTRSAKYNHMERTHRMKKDSDIKYPCTNCPRTFANKLTLESHISKKHYDL